MMASTKGCKGCELGIYVHQCLMGKMWCSMLWLSKAIENGHLKLPRLKPRDVPPHTCIFWIIPTIKPICSTCGKHYIWTGDN
jgi:hypothetical protein